jgi:hypothetical protein
MKRVILIFLLIFTAGFVFSADYSKIDIHAGSVPSNLNNVKDITRYLTKNLNSPTDKVRAIYYWMAHAIRYDISKMNSNLTYTDPQQLVDEVLRTRKGVCANYSALFHACCQSAGIQSYIIDGYTRQYDKISMLAHSWNAVNINGEYYNIDVTWAAGFVRGNIYTHRFRDNFFMIEPDEFIKTHMPFDPIWQFSNNPITHREFESGDFSKLTSTSTFHFYDSITVQNGLNLTEKLMRENQRILKYGITNSMIRTKVLQNKQEITTEKYNTAVNIFNAGVNKYNDYIRYKNKQFNNLSLKDDEILELLSSSRQLFESADQILSTLNQDKGDLKNPIQSMEKSIKRMIKDMNEEDVFMNKYVNTPKSNRMFLFYTKKGE